MDMNIKRKFGLKNKKLQMAASLMQKFLLVMAFFVMMVGVGHGGSYDPFLTEKSSQNPDGVAYTGTDYDVYNHSSNDESLDKWASSPGGYTGPDYTDYYIGTFEGNIGLNSNQNNTDIRDLIRHFLNDFSIEFFGYDKDDGEESLELDNLTVTWNSTDNNLSGTWSVTNEDPTSSDDKINFYSVKGDNYFALYYVQPSKNSGNWTTRHLRDPDSNPPQISHFVVVRSTEMVPEPATMLLFGFSLMGLAGIARRRNSKF